MSYYNYRYYIPFISKWNSRDSNEEVSDNNLYLFINNSVTDKFDHLGQMSIILGPNDDVAPDDLCCLEYMDMWMLEGYVSKADCRSKCVSSYYAGQGAAIIALVFGICSMARDPVTAKSCGILSTLIGGYTIGISYGCSIACEMNVCRSFSSPEKYNYIGRNWYFRKVCKTKYRCPPFQDFRD